MIKKTNNFLGFCIKTKRRENENSNKTKWTFQKLFNLAWDKSLFQSKN